MEGLQRNFRIFKKKIEIVLTCIDQRFVHLIIPDSLKQLQFTFDWDWILSYSKAAEIKRLMISGKTKVIH